MKYLIAIFLSLIITNAFSQSDYKWEEFEDPLMIDKTNAKKVKKYENTPESVVTYFYASRIRGDNKWEKIIPPEAERSDRLERKLETYAKWNITKFHLVSKTEYEKNKYWVKVYFEIEINGKTDSGTDEATVILKNGKWIISSVPT